MVERKPSKLGVAGSSPVSRSKIVARERISRGSYTQGESSMFNLCYAQVAQSVEHVLGKDEVGGSIPLLGFAPTLTFESAGSFNFEL